MTAASPRPKASAFGTRSQAPELLDDIAHQTPELHANLRDVYKLSQLMGVTRWLVKQVGDLTSASNSVMRVLDVGAGSGDIAIALVRAAGKVGRNIHVTAVDMSPVVANIARRNTRAYGSIEVVVGNGIQLPFHTATFDVAICSMTLHHLSEPQAAALLRNLDRVTTSGFVVVDLLRSRLAYSGAWLATRILTRNELSRHDGPLSVLRAFTLAELHALVTDADVDHTTVSALFPWVAAVVQTKPSSRVAH